MVISVHYFGDKLTRMGGLVATLLLISLCVGCGLLDNDGPIEVKTQAMGSEAYNRYLDEVTPVEPGTVFTLQVLEYCAQDTMCSEDEITITGVTLESNDGVLKYRDHYTGGIHGKTGMVELEAVGRGRAIVNIEYERGKGPGEIRREFHVVDPDGVQLKQCAENAYILDGDPEVSLLQGFLYEDEHMISNGYDPSTSTLTFEPQGGFEMTGRGPFWGDFRKVEPGDIELHTYLKIYYSDNYGEHFDPNEDGVVTYQAASVSSIASIETSHHVNYSDVNEPPDGLSIGVELKLREGKYFCSEPYYHVDVLTPEVCELTDWKAHSIDDRTSFSSINVTSDPNLLVFDAPDGGTCRVEISVTSPGGESRSKTVEVDVAR